MTPLPLFMHQNGECRRDQPANGNGSGNGIPGSDQLIGIEFPVGQGFKARNLDGDVRTIQDSLNKIKPLHGGPVVALDVDGKCGPKTKRAIVDFQLKQFKSKGADGLIEPGKQTITRINQLLFSAIPIDPAEHLKIKAQIVAHMSLVSRSIHASQASLMRALTPGGGPIDFGQGAANGRLDRHFKLDKLPKSQRSSAIRNILSVFNMFQSALLMPGALGTGAFEMDPTGDPRIAFTFGNGFFMTDLIHPEKNIRLDRIYLGRRAFFAISDADLCAFIMLHEMAHFVGFPGGGFIGDNGRGWFTDSTIDKLTPNQRLLNADCYAGYAIECRTGDSNKPPYVKASTTSR